MSQRAMSGPSVGKTAPASSDSGDSRPRRGARRADPPEFSQVLDRLRESLLHRLERVEAIAAEQDALLKQDSSEREQALRERVALLEATQSRLLAEAKRREQEWQSVMSDLDSDRRLLAEAWDNIERERIAGPANPTSRPAAGHEVPLAALPEPTEPARPRPPGDPDDHVTQSILWQFRTLKSDVRRNAKRRNGS
jgi:hypothetical protein